MTYVARQPVLHISGFHNPNNYHHHEYGCEGGDNQ
jgi:hypothetical protein